MPNQEIRRSNYKLITDMKTYYQKYDSFYSELHYHIQKIKSNQFEIRPLQCYNYKRKKLCGI